MDIVENDRIPNGTCFLSLKKSGVDWFDEILANDEVLKIAVSIFDLVGISKRMDELRAEYNIPKPKSALD